MKSIKIEHIDLGKLAKDVRRYENKWIAVSAGNKIVGSGSTYGEAVEKSEGNEVVLFKVPPLDVSLAP